MTDRELLEAWGAGDHSAAEALLTRHMTTVHRFFYGKLDDGVDDLVQQTFLKCLERRDSFRGDSSFVSFVLGIARYELLTVYRRRDVRGTFEPARSSIHDVHPRPSEVLALRETKQVLLEAVRRLPFDQQVLLEFAYWQRLKSHEIADALGIPAPTIRRHLSSARAALRDKIKVLVATPELARATTESFEKWADEVRDETA